MKHVLISIYFVLVAELQRKVSVVIIDGVCIGHPCRGIPNCKNLLQSNWDHFCSTHDGQNNICAVNDCRNSVLSGSKVCHLTTHQETERMHNKQGQSRFQLREHLQRARIACPNNSAATTELSIDDDNSDDLVDGNGEIEFDIQQDGHLIPSSTDTRSLNTSWKLCAWFGRKRTHNEQLFVAPCGIIVAWKTFFHSEALSEVIVGVSTMPPENLDTIDSLNDHLGDDQADLSSSQNHAWSYFLWQQLYHCKNGQEWSVFKNVRLTVDVFHFKCKHSEKDVFCQEHCNPVMRRLQS